MSEESVGVGKLMEAIKGKWPEENMKSRKIVKESDGRILHFWNGNQLESPPHKCTILCSTPLATSGIFEMAPGQWGLPDVHTGCEIYLCMEGTVTVEGGDTCKDVNAGELFYVAPGETHRVFNHTDKSVKVFFTVSGGMEAPNK